MIYSQSSGHHSKSPNTSKLPDSLNFPYKLHFLVIFKNNFSHNHRIKYNFYIPGDQIHGFLTLAQN